MNHQEQTKNHDNTVSSGAKYDNTCKRFTIYFQSKMNTHIFEYIKKSINNFNVYCFSCISSVTYNFHFKKQRNTWYYFQLHYRRQCPFMWCMFAIYHTFQQCSIGVFRWCIHKRYCLISSTCPGSYCIPILQREECCMTTWFDFKAEISGRVAHVRGTCNWL